MKFVNLYRSAALVLSLAVAPIANHAADALAAPIKSKAAHAHAQTQKAKHPTPATATSHPKHRASLKTRGLKQKKGRECGDNDVECQ